MATRATPGGRLPASPGAAAQVECGTNGRVVSLDNLKVLVISLIIALHAVLSYDGTLEAWTYSEFREVTLHPVTDTLLFAVAAPFGFLMVPLLFLVAGTLTPGSLARKGVRRFAIDRLLRLGVPFLVFVLLLEPTLTYALEHPLGDAPGSWTEEYLGAEKRLDTGPVWFVGVLLIFSLGYAALVTLHPKAQPLASRQSITPRFLLTLSGVVAALSFLVRLIYPFGSEAGRSDMQFWEWPVCLAMFGLGITVGAQGWITTVPAALARQCRRITFVTLPAMMGLILGAGAADRVDEGQGGLHWLAVGFAVIEAPLTICGAIWLLEVSQRRLNRRYRGDAMLSRTCYAAFIVQGVALIGLAGLLRQVSSPAEVKALVLAVGSVAGSFLLARALLLVPGARRIL